MIEPDTPHPERPERDPTLKRTVVLLALVAALPAALVCLWTAWCEFPIYAWNEARLAPAFALRHGINPYPPLGGGPLSTWIYGPVGILINLPATFAASPAAALQVASLVNFAVILAPLAFVFFGARELRGRGTVGLLALAVALLLVPRPNLVLQVPDHSAIALGLLSCWLLARAVLPAGATLVAAAACAALAVWAKQITLFLLPAQFVYLWLATGRGTALRYTAWVAAFGGAGFALAGWAFGFGNLWLNTVEIPARLPWADVAERLAMRPWSLAAQLILPGTGLLVLWRARLWPARSTASGRFFQLTVLAFLTQLPVGLVAYLKIGGDTNLLHSWDYLLPGVLLAWLAVERDTPAGRLRLAAVVAVALALRWGDLSAPPPRPHIEHLQVAAQLDAVEPGGLWFPLNPVTNFYFHRQLWHTEDGIQTRFVAGYGLREPDFRRHLPPSLRGIVYPANVPTPFSKLLLADYDQQTRVPYWIIHHRLNPAQP
jgi:hypothetical protein